MLTEMAIEAIRTSRGDAGVRPFVKQHRDRVMFACFPEASVLRGAQHQPLDWVGPEYDSSHAFRQSCLQIGHHGFGIVPREQRRAPESVGRL